MQCTKTSFKKEIFKTGREETINNVKYKPCALTATCKSISVMKKNALQGTLSVLQLTLLLDSFITSLIDTTERFLINHEQQY